MNAHPCPPAPAAPDSGEPPVAPDGMPFTMKPYVGGDIEVCGATRWVDDNDQSIQQGEQLLTALVGALHVWQPRANALVVMSQQRWFSGVGPVGHAGFRVECRQERDHGDECQFPTSAPARDLTV